MTAFFFVLAAVGGYLLGSIPFGLVLTRAAGLGDIRNIGSGNIGATNVLRTGRWDIAAATVILDAAKAGIALIVARLLWPWGNEGWTEIGLVAGGAAFLGHCFPVWLNFKGGKGVATFFGVLIAGVWPIGLLAAVVWVCVFVIFRYSSLAALCAAAIAPLAALIAQFAWSEVVFTIVIGALIYWRHAANIQRLRAGTEPKTSFRSKKEAVVTPTAEPPKEPAAPADS